MEQTRRRFLTASAVVGTGALAGCNAVTDAIPFVGGGGLGDYQQWAYPADQFNQDADGMSVNVTNQQAIYENRKSFYPNTYRALRGTYSTVGLIGRDVSMDLRLPQGRVLKGSYDTSEVVAELEDDTNTEFESDGNYSGYEVYVPSDADTVRQAVAVADSAIVFGQRVEPPFGSDWDAVSATDVVEGIIDTKGGNGTRATSNNDDFSTLVNTLDSGTSISAETRSDEVSSDQADAESGIFEGQVANGESLSVNGDTTKRQWVFVFSGEGDVNTSDLNDWIEANDNSGTFARARNVKVEQNGRAGVVTAKFDTYSL
ncbi:hypothetical protein BV210_10035 [Halorientalis sp. IM1011]|uniref:hypothetical protein n=1 Tax=Halorientalis sp. IM1011 TaxID=1932360 RepID=UPI00097CD004|nr:hypothetical protein [Halorientalis sp. IM1011]AQL43035.1 hypothetical protein BV210_10035 [Halorientalis sp. IM1011]